MSETGAAVAVGRGDLDGFFGLMVDNLLQFLVILSMCTGMCGLSAGFVLGRIFPAAALSLIVGNLYYAWLARRLSREQGRKFTALPYVGGLLTLKAGFLFSATFLAAIAVFLAERSFGKAAIWAVAAAAFSMVGLMHAYTITPVAVREEIRPGFAWQMALGYLGFALVALLAKVFAKSAESPDRSGAAGSGDRLLPAQSWSKGSPRGTRPSR